MNTGPNISSSPLTVIEPERGLLRTLIRELPEYRELLGFFIWRDLKVRYRQTVLGMLWAVARPLISMAVFTFLFHRVAQVSSGDVPYPVFALCGVLVWTFFSEGVTTSSQSLLANANLVTKVYFPRILIPTAAVFRGVIDASVGLLLCVAALVFIGHVPGWEVLLALPAAIWTLLVTLGLGLWSTALGVRYRDIAHALPYLVQLLMWVSPIGYPSTAVPGSYRVLFWLNPLTGAVEWMRTALLGTPCPDAPLMVLSLGVAFAILITGVLMFQRLERQFADVI
jgi:lipopolysaccharide transport system permease protein